MKIEWDEKKLLSRVSDIADAVAKNGAERIASDARNILTQNQSVDTGELKGTIRVEKSKYPEGGYIVKMGSKKAWYGPFVELGTPGTSYKAKSMKGKSRIPIKAKPFMRPALEKNKKKIARDFQKALS